MLSLKQAALRVGKGKSTLQREIKAGKLSATRDEKQRYKIDPAELARVYPDDYAKHENAGEEGAVSKRPVSSQWDSAERPRAARNDPMGHSGTPEDAVDQSTNEAMALVRTMIASVETAKADEIRRLEETIEDLRERLDKESAQNRALTQMITDQRTAPPEKEKKGFLSFLRA
jgi:ATP-dependent exoDNAse (exonuclease V) beta subunit